MTTVKKARELALRVLDQHWQEGSIAVDPFTIAERLGVTVRIGSLPDNASGALYKLGPGKYEIAVSKDDTRTRQRFTCAHELGHFMDREEHEEPQEMVDYRDASSATGLNPRERFANAFAAELLMPGWAVQQYRSVGYGTETLARIFQVSPSAMAIRISKL
jgi:Zn-dependent peptidase ImmA (M78 family)